MDSLENKQRAYEEMQRLQPALKIAEGMRMAGYDEEEDAAVLHRVKELEAQIKELAADKPAETRADRISAAREELTAALKGEPQ